MESKKSVIYQVFTRLFGNKNRTNTPWADKEINGVGKFSDFTETALQQIKELGVTHIWYTGVLHHATVDDFPSIALQGDHPSIVKGRAGSPYSIKDYYQVAPALAEQPEKRLQEFEALIERTHRCGLKVIIDIVPNHVARQYQGMNNPIGTEDFGVNDNREVEYHRDNNFYYRPKDSFISPDLPEEVASLGGHSHPLLPQPYEEYPAKWTANGSRTAKPSADDWYEAVKINYGIQPDGSKDFPSLPSLMREKNCQQHFNFWLDKDVPDSWRKFRDITLYWLEKGVDGFRYDVAELVPVEFWSYLNSTIKKQKSDAFLLAEVYQPTMFRDYIQLGKMDYLYDKVDLYDTLKGIIQGRVSTEEIAKVQHQLSDIDAHMLRFLENHDEQRIASPEFAGHPKLAQPAMLITATLGCAPTMIYFGQEVGEPAKERAGFGQPSRTSIFDYIGVPHHQDWMNNGSFDGALLSKEQHQLRDFYRSVLHYSLTTPALNGEYIDIWSQVQDQLGHNRDALFLFGRKQEKSRAVIITNFHSQQEVHLNLSLPEIVINKLELAVGSTALIDQISQQNRAKLTVDKHKARLTVDLPPLAAFAFDLVDD